MEKKGESWPAAGSSSDFQSSDRNCNARAGVLCARPCVAPMCEAARLDRILPGRGQVVTGKKYGVLSRFCFELSPLSAQLAFPCTCSTPYLVS